MRREFNKRKRPEKRLVIFILMRYMQVLYKERFRQRSIIGNVDQKDVKIDSRIIEVDFGNYELRSYFKLGLKMTSYWAFPELLPNPKSVESVKSMVKRSQSFLKELEKKNYENVLIVCHGGIIRSLCGYLEDRKNGIKWRPKPNNCEIRVYESNHGKHTFIETFK